MNEESLFHLAQQQPDAAARAAFLEEACANQPELRARLEKLLQAHDAPVSLFDKPVVEIDTTIDSSGDSGPGEDSFLAASPPTEGPGTRIGPYKLLQKIGEGGMGVVWMAEQEQPVRRKVALKIIKPGMDSRQVIARFEVERQALALMDHLNIARVLDGGATDSGRPFFVMELIHGIPITQYCDDNQLTPRERLELFLPVCQAIQHAHQKGIIHRDVKPSNVLVTLYDGKPVPKVIDFGVAKAVEQRLTEQTLCTQYGSIIGTFEYMSPEQAEMSALGVDTRSDIYSLGVLLYELLTGTTPLERQRLRTVSYPEIVRLIREEEPPRPSTRLSHSETLPAVAAARKMEPVKLTRLVRGELDWIVMKALEKDRDRRYETANGLARDVQRYLANEPVRACPPSMGYRLRKFLSRNRGALAVTAAVVLVLIAGIAVLAISNGRIRTALDAAEEAEMQAQDNELLAKQKAAEAETQRRRAEKNLVKAVEAVDQMLTRVSEERLLYLPQMMQVRRGLLQDALKFYEEFLEQKSDDPELQLQAALANKRVGAIQNVFEQYGRGEEAYHRAIEILGKLTAHSTLGPKARRLLVPCHQGHFWSLNATGKRDEALKSMRRGIEIAEALVDDFPNNPDDLNQLVSISNGLADNCLRSQPEQAEKLLRRNLALAASPFDLMRTYRSLGALYASQSRYAQAERAYRQSLEQSDKMEPQNADTTRGERALTLGGYLARSLAAQGRHQEAEETQQRALAIWRDLVADYPSVPRHQVRLANCYVQLARIQKTLKDMAQAEQSYRQAIAVFEKLARKFPTNPDYQKSSFEQSLGLGGLLRQSGQMKEAQQVYAEAAERAERLAGDFASRLAHWQGLVRSHIELAGTLLATGKKAEGVAAYQKAIEIQEKLQKGIQEKLQKEGQEELARVTLKHILALTYLDQGMALEGLARYRDAEAAIRQAERLTDELQALRFPNNLNLSVRERLALLLARHLNRPEEGERVYRANVAAMEARTKKQPRPDGSWRSALAFTHRHWAWAMWDTGHYQKAIDAYRAAIELGEELCAKFPGGPAAYVFIVQNTCWCLAGWLLDCPDPKLRDPAEAVTLLSRAIELVPDNWGFRERRGRAYLAIGESEKARQDFEKYVELLTKAVKDKPDDWSAWNSRGVGYSKLRRWQEAIADFTHALELPKADEGLVRGNRAFCRCEQGRWREAAADFVRIMELRPANSNSHYQHALAQLGLGDLDGYRQSCAAMRKRFLKSTNPNDAFWLPWTCLLAPDALADFSPVLALVEKAAETAPAPASFAVHRGGLLYRAGRWQEAIDGLKEAERQAEKATGGIQSSPAYAWYFLAMAHQRLGKAKEARRWLDKAVAWTEDVLKEHDKGGKRLPWNRRLTLRLLRQEAEALLDAEAKNKEQK